MKPMTLTCVLTVSKQQLAENAFKDAIMDLIYSCTLEYLSGESYRQSFPDLVVFANLQVSIIFILFLLLSNINFNEC